MAIRDTSAIGDAVNKVTARPQANAKTEKKEKVAEDSASGRKNSSGDVVDISTKTGGVVERHGAARPQNEAGRTVSEEEKRSETREDNDSGDEAQNVRRDYTVDNSELVVKVIDTKENEVIREIPPEEERRIREAMSELAEENLDKNPPEDGHGHIDITS